MTKRISVLLLLLLLASALFAESEQPHYDGRLSKEELIPYNDAIEAFLSERPRRSASSL